MPWRMDCSSAKKPKQAEVPFQSLSAVQRFWIWVMRESVERVEGEGLRMARVLEDEASEISDAHLTPSFGRGERVGLGEGLRLVEVAESSVEDPKLSFEAVRSSKGISNGSISVSFGFQGIGCVTPGSTSNENTILKRILDSVSVEVAVRASRRKLALWGVWQVQHQFFFRTRYRLSAWLRTRSNSVVRILRRCLVGSSRRL